MTFVAKKGALIGSTLIAMTCSSVVQAAPYEVIDLGTLGGNQNYAFSINNLNQVVGSSQGAIVADDASDDATRRTCFVDNTITIREFCNHAYLFSGGILNDLGELNADNSNAISINDLSIAVGYAAEIIDDGDPDTIDSVRTRAIISYNGANVEALPYPAESDNLGEGILQEQRAQYISNENKVVGYSLVTTFVSDTDVITNAYRPFIYDIETDNYQILPVFEDAAALNAYGRSINSAGEVVGAAVKALDDGRTALRAFFWDPLNPEFSQDLGTLGGFSSQARDINDNGYVIGVSDTDENFFRNQELAFVYDLNTETMTQIPEFSQIDEYRSAVPYSINNSNEVVGSSQVSASFGNLSAAFKWTVGDPALVNLNDMIDCDSGWNLVIARDINEAGYITGTGTLNGEVRSFMLVPTGDTTPTFCSQPDGEAPDDPVDNDDSGSGSTGMLTLLMLAITSLLRRRRTSKTAP
jgi:uncharacterized membrane protein